MQIKFWFAMDVTVQWILFNQCLYSVILFQIMLKFTKLWSFVSQLTECYFYGFRSHRLRIQCFLRLWLVVELLESLFIWGNNSFDNKPSSSLVVLLMLLCLLCHCNNAFSPIMYRKWFSATYSTVIIMLLTETLPEHYRSYPIHKKKVLSIRHSRV